MAINIGASLHFLHLCPNDGRSIKVLTKKTFKLVTEHLTSSSEDSCGGGLGTRLDVGVLDCVSGHSQHWHTVLGSLHPWCKVHVHAPLLQ